MDVWDLYDSGGNKLFCECVRVCVWNGIFQKSFVSPGWGYKWDFQEGIRMSELGNSRGIFRLRIVEFPKGMRKLGGNSIG